MISGVGFVMSTKRHLFAFLLILFFARLSIAIDLRQYVGKSSCSLGLERGVGSYGIRLDKSQIARLEARTSNGNKILMIVQYTKESDECGIVRDIVRASNGTAHFVFECVNPKSPSSVAVGTWPDDFRRASAPALEAWRIELDGLQFEPLIGRVTCTSRNYAGNDNGSDLVKWAKQRAAKRRLSDQNDQGVH
jgi:hypothetical protein